MTDLIRAYINITEEDKATLEHAYGRGWSAHVREWIHERCVSIRQDHSRATNMTEFMDD